MNVVISRRAFSAAAYCLNENPAIVAGFKIGLPINDNRIMCGQIERVISSRRKMSEASDRARESPRGLLGVG